MISTWTSLPVPRIPILSVKGDYMSRVEWIHNRPLFFSCPGCPVHVLYESVFDGQQVKLVEVGSENLQDRINSYAPYTDLFYMLKRLSVGDNSVLSCRPALYGDFSGMPDNPVDAINLVHHAQDAFARLPADQKQDCNNDYRVWLAQLLSGGVEDVSRETFEPDTADSQSDSAGA